MPSPLRQLFSRHKANEGKLGPESEKSPRSPKSPKSPKSPRSPSKPLTWTEENKDFLTQCLGCKTVATFIGQNIERQKNGEERLHSAVLHYSFNELGTCARRCDYCRVFRQSLVLEEVTFGGAQLMRETKGAVIVYWCERTAADGSLRTFLEVKIDGASNQAGIVNLSNLNERPHLALRSNSRDLSVINQARQWLNTCRESHIGQCENLSFSTETPKLLIRILSDRSIQLCKRQQAEYVALSYCWGHPEEGSTEWKQTERGKTTNDNLERRLQPFSIDELPATVRDALHFIHAMGIRYAWVDTLCINQITSEGIEEMHIVYSNALFTLCSCATTAATARLLDHREAWTHATEPCRLGGQWLTTADMSLNELRLRSPLAVRAWTLQEERLSPRMLYVSSSRLYWSCAAGNEIEMKPTHERRPTKLLRPWYTPSDRSLEMPPAQDFLLSCTGRNTPGHDRDLHEYWTDIVKSYTLRVMWDPEDRLKALSGVAARYLNARNTDEYLAGLWANNLVDGLTWKVQAAADAEKVAPKASGYPSWSWAKLPYPSAIDMGPQNPTSSPFFHRVPENTTRISALEEKDAIIRGQAAQHLRVQSRMRALWHSTSRSVPWSSITKTVDDKERYTFAASPETNMHAIHAASGRVLVYEDRKREVLCQLDFMQDIQRLQSGQLSLWALEVGETTMLLLEHCGGDIYRRVGAVWDVRRDFFALAGESGEVMLW